MALPQPINNASGLLVANTLTTIFPSPGTGRIAKIRSVRFSGNDFTTAFNLKFYISIDEGDTDILVYSRQYSGGDICDDDNIYFISEDMRLKAWTDQSIVSYS